MLDKAKSPIVIATSVALAICFIGAIVIWAGKAECVTEAEKGSAAMVLFVAIVNVVISMRDLPDLVSISLAVIYIAIDNHCVWAQYADQNKGLLSCLKTPLAGEVLLMMGALASFVALPVPWITPVLNRSRLVEIAHLGAATLFIWIGSIIVWSQQISNLSQIVAWFGFSVGVIWEFKQAELFGFFACSLSMYSSWTLMFQYSNEGTIVAGYCLIFLGMVIAVTRPILIWFINRSTVVNPSGGGSVPAPPQTYPGPTPGGYTPAPQGFTSAPQGFTSAPQGFTSAPEGYLNNPSTTNDVGPGAGYAQFV